MKEVDKILNQIEDCIKNNYYLPVETEKVELKVTPSMLKTSGALLQSIDAFLNTNGGILILGIKDNNNIANKNYELTGYNEEYEATLKTIGKQFTDKDFNELNVSAAIIGFEIRQLLDKRVCILYIDKLPEEQKYVFYNRVAYERRLTGDHRIADNKIQRHEEFKEEIKNARELRIENGTTLDDIDIDKLNEYILLLNKEVRTETIKGDIASAIPFLTRKKFIIGDKITTLGLLVCGNHVKDFLGWRAQVDGFVDTQYDVAQDKKTLIDNVIPLMEKSLGYILKNIQVGVIIANGGTSKPEYPEKLLRETVNNAIAHRDYSIDKYININIKPNEYIEIRNPGSFKKQILIEILDHEIPVRRIIPDSKPRNPKLADVLNVFDKWEGKARGMGNLVNDALENNIDLPYYRFYSNDDLGLFIIKGKLLDDNFNNLLEIFNLFIETKLNGATITQEEKAVLAYFYKSEKANQQYRYTILLSPDNNHFNAIRRLELSGLIFKHHYSPELYPVYLLHRVLMKDNYITELRTIYGGVFDELPDLNKEVLSLLFQINNYNKKKTLSVTEAVHILYKKLYSSTTEIKIFESFKRKIYSIFRKLIADKLLIKEGGKYFLNLNFNRTISIFDKQ